MTDFSVGFNTDKGVILLNNQKAKSSENTNSFHEVIKTAIKNPLGIVAGGIKSVRQYFNKEELKEIEKKLKLDTDDEELMQMIISLERKLKKYKEKKG